MNFDYKKALYRRNNFGQVCVWAANSNIDNSIIIHHGILGKSITCDRILTDRALADEIKSRIAAKRKAGYKMLHEVKDNINLPVEEELLPYLDKYLPIHRTTADGSLLPMLAKVYDNTNNRLYNKVDHYIGQWKINGLRCFISAVRNEHDMFNPIGLRFRSREGTYWNTLSVLEEYLISIIDQKFLVKMLEEHYILDGELYLPGYAVNEINHFVKDAKCPQNKLIQYWCYDLAIEDTIQETRLVTLHREFHRNVRIFKSKEEHLNVTEQFVVLPNIAILNNNQAVQVRDTFINMGFEGLILRNPIAEYQYGKRNLSMIKFKRSTDGKFTIIDIYPEGIKRPDIPLFLCRNDINDGTFEVHVGGSQDYQRKCLIDKDKYIGKTMYVEYGERSGVKEVPFHIKETRILD